MIFDLLGLKKPITYTSPIHGTITIGTQKENKSVYSGGVTQSGGEIGYMWKKVLGGYYQTHKKPKHILILGVGGGSTIAAIRTHDKKVNITGVELDPVMKQIAQEQFGLTENKKQHIIIADAISYLYQETKQYDVIIVDLYIGPLNPTKSRTKKYLQQLKKLLTKNGTVLYNAHFQKRNTGEHEKFFHILTTTFTTVEEVFFYPLNKVFLLKSS